MKNLPAITLVICVNALFIFFLVHKENQIIKVKRDIQQYQNQINKLQEKIAQTEYELSKLCNPDNIKKFSQEKLGMRAINLKEIQRYDA